jgi:hypothetical protein
MKINYDQILIGKDSGGEIITADHKDGKITCLNMYVLIHPTESYDECYYLVCWGCGGDYDIEGHVFTRGMSISEDFEPLGFTEEELENIENAYEGHGSFCSSCGTFHDTEGQYGNLSYTILDCELYCKDCVGADDLIAYTPVQSVDDIYNAKDIVGMSPEEFEEVETIFHDCGWGGPATNHEGAKRIVDDLLEEHGEIYAALTGIGQFQVYVTLYKPKAAA